MFLMIFFQLHLHHMVWRDIANTICSWVRVLLKHIVQNAADVTAKMKMASSVDIPNERLIWSYLNLNSFLLNTQRSKRTSLKPRHIIVPVPTQYLDFWRRMSCSFLCQWFEVRNNSCITNRGLKEQPLNVCIFSYWLCPQLINHWNGHNVYWQ